MALFEKQPITNSSSPLYTIGAHKSTLIIGLGNIGEEHQGSRHNIGFEAVDKFAADNDFPAWSAKKDLKSHLSIQNMGDNRVILCKPQTYMNLSGEAATAVQRFFRVYNPTTLVVYDELALPFGQLRTRLGGSDAGHNGVKSLIQHIGDDFGRLRIGIGSDLAQTKDASDFVLAKFTEDEQNKVPLILREATAMISEYIHGGQLPHDTRSVV